VLENRCTRNRRFVPRRATYSILSRVFQSGQTRRADHAGDREKKRLGGRKRLLQCALESLPVHGLIFEQTSRQRDLRPRNPNTSRHERNFLRQGRDRLAEQRTRSAIPLFRGGKNAPRPLRHRGLARVLQQKRHEFLHGSLACCGQKFPRQRRDLPLLVVGGIGRLQSATRKIVRAPAVREKMAPTARFLDRLLRRFLPRDIRPRPGNYHDTGPLAECRRQHRAGVFHHADQFRLGPHAPQNFLHARFLLRQLASGKSPANGPNARARLAPNPAKKFLQRRLRQQQRIARPRRALRQNLAMGRQQRPRSLRPAAFHAENAQRLFVSSHHATITDRIVESSISF
jgi:hypothetical protein